LRRETLFLEIKAERKKMKILKGKGLIVAAVAPCLSLG